jgi:hypothetical protein
MQLVAGKTMLINKELKKGDLFHWWVNGDSGNV